MSEDQAVIVEVVLVGTRPGVRRLISVPYSLPLRRFHTVLQLVMGWERDAGHAFVAEDLIAGDLYEVSSPIVDPEDESRLAVKDLLPFISAKAAYYYDFVRDWRHRLRLVDFDPQPRTNEFVLLKAGGQCPVESGARRAPVRARKRPSKAGKNRSKVATGLVDIAAINEELVRLSKRWKRKRGLPARNSSLEMILLDTRAIRAGYLEDLQSVRKNILTIEDELARHESQDVPEFRRCVNLEFGARFSIMRELHQEIDWLAARLALVQKLMQHGIRPVGRAYLLALQIEAGEAPYPDFPPQRDEEIPPEPPEPENMFARETIRNFISETGAEFLTEEEVESLTEDVLQTADARDLVTECKRLYRKIVSLLHPDRAGEMTPERKDLWLRTQDAYADGDVLSLKSILDRCGASTPDQYLTCSEIIEAIAEAMMQLHAIEMFREREANEPSWNFSRLKEKKRKSRLRRVTKDLDEEENILRIQLAELQRECQSLEKEAKRWESKHGSGSVQLDLFR